MTTPYKSSSVTTTSHRLPILTLSVLLITATVTGLQQCYPGLLNALQRRPEAYTHGEWWRLFTSLLVHDQGWSQIAFNLIAIAIIGTWIERLFGRRRWLIFYLVGGVMGQIAGYAWQPQGAGASVAGAGLLGALLVWLLVSGKGLPLQIRIWGALGPVGAVVLVVCRDIHGPPIIAGAGLASLML